MASPTVVPPRVAHRAEGNRRSERHGQQPPRQHPDAQRGERDVADGEHAYRSPVGLEVHQ